VDKIKAVYEEKKELEQTVDQLEAKND